MATKLLLHIDKKLSEICDDLKEKAIEDCIMLKWKYAATCLDKMSFYLVSIGSLLHS